MRISNLLMLGFMLGTICAENYAATIDNDFFITYSGKQITASDSCDMYETVSLHSRTSSNQNVLQYWLSNPDNIELPPIDSVWVINPDQEVVLVSYAQPMEDIDISFLPNWVYVLYIQLGECVKSKVLFVGRNQGQALDDITVEAPIYKIIRDGQLYIRREGKTYRLDGSITTCQ